MATKKQNPKKSAAKPQAKKAPAKKSLKLMDIQILTKNEKLKELLKDPKFKAEFEKRKQAIIDGHQHIQSPPYSCKPMVCKKSGLVVLLQIQPSNPRSIHRGPCAVTITTFIGRLQYKEQLELPNLRRACEYIKDYGVEQCARFTDIAVSKHAMDVVDAVTRDLMPMINGEQKSEVNTRQADNADQRREAGK